MVSKFPALCGTRRSDNSLSLDSIPSQLNLQDTLPYHTPTYVYVSHLIPSVQVF